MNRVKEKENNQIQILLTIFGVTLIIIILGLIIFKSELFKCTDIFIFIILAIAISLLSIFLTGYIEFEKTVSETMVRGGGAIGLLLILLYIIINNYDKICNSTPQTLFPKEISIKSNELSKKIIPIEIKGTKYNYPTKYNSDTHGDNGKILFDSPKESLVRVYLYKNIPIPKSAKNAKIKIQRIELSTSLYEENINREDIVIVGIQAGKIDPKNINSKNLNSVITLGSLNEGNNPNLSGSEFAISDKEKFIGIAILLEDRWKNHRIKIDINDLVIEFGN